MSSPGPARTCMPEVSRFYGIVIRIFYDDHNPPHFHAEYGEHEVLVNINTLAILGGSLPARALGMVAEWSPCISASCWRRGKGRADSCRQGGLSRSHERPPSSHDTYQAPVTAHVSRKMTRRRWPT